MDKLDVYAVVTSYFESKINNEISMSDPKFAAPRRDYINTLKRLAYSESEDVEVLLNNAYKRGLIDRSQLEELLMLNRIEIAEIKFWKKRMGANFPHS